MGPLLFEEQTPRRLARARWRAFLQCAWQIASVCVGITCPEGGDQPARLTAVRPASLPLLAVTCSGFGTSSLLRVSSGLPVVLRALSRLPFPATERAHHCCRDRLTVAH